MNEEQARSLNTCPACSTYKNTSLVVCWRCFEWGYLGVEAYRDFKGGFEGWIEKVDLAEVEYRES